MYLDTTFESVVRSVTDLFVMYSKSLSAVLSSSFWPYQSLFRYSVTSNRLSPQLYQMAKPLFYEDTILITCLNVLGDFSNSLDVHIPF